MKYAIRVDGATGEILGVWTGATEVPQSRTAAEHYVQIPPELAREIQAYGLRHQAGGSIAWAWDEKVGVTLRPDVRPMLRVVGGDIRLAEASADHYADVEALDADGRRDTTYAGEVDLVVQWRGESKLVRLSFARGVAALRISRRSSGLGVLTSGSVALIEGGGVQISVVGDGLD